jgi:hypothetical protein
VLLADAPLSSSVAVWARKVCAYVTVRSLVLVGGGGGMGDELEGIWKETLVAWSFYSFDILERLKSRRSLGKLMSGPIFAPGTRCAVFSDGVHLPNHGADIPCSSVSQTGFRKEVSGVPRGKCVMAGEFCLRSYIFAYELNSCGCIRHWPFRHWQGADNRCFNPEASWFCCQVSTVRLRVDVSGETIGLSISFRLAADSYV